MNLKHILHNAATIIRGNSGTVAGSNAYYRGAAALPSGLSQLDRVMGIKGLPQGRITELIGTESTGTLSIAFKIAAKFQRKQLPVMIIDMAGSIETGHAVRCGLVTPELLLVTPANAFELITLMGEAARQKGLIIINLGFAPQTLAGAGRRVLAALLHRLRRISGKSRSVFLYVTVPEQADPLIHTNYPPGFPLNEIADVRLWVQDEGWIKSSHQISGYRGSVTVIKNRLAPQGKGASLRIKFVDPKMARLSDEFGF